MGHSALPGVLPIRKNSKMIYHSMMPIMEMHMNKEAWLDRWEITGSYMQCRVCKARQHMNSGASPFLHLEGCTAVTRFSELPWRDYSSLLRLTLSSEEASHPSANS